MMVRVTALFSLLALWPTIVPLLGIVMLGIGLTLPYANFHDVVSHPGLPTGMVWVGNCPAGRASNFVCYLARPDVALSITLSTLLAVIATPLLAWPYVGQRVPASVPVAVVLGGILLFAIVPVLLGRLLNSWWRRFGRGLRVSVDSDATGS